MKLCSRLLASGLIAALALSSMAPAVAQVPSISAIQPAQLKTYRATIVGLVPAASATDLFTLGGVAGITVHWVKCNGTSTAAATAVLQIVKRSTADTGGTSTTPTITRLNANFPVAGGVVRAYTANPTLGTAIGTIDVQELTTNTVASSAFASVSTMFDFSNQWLWLDAATTYVAVNANATSLTAGASLNCTIEWTEQ